MGAKKVLIIDDEPAVLLLVKIILSDQYDVVQADSGKKALELLKREIPDLILLDIMMPHMDGWEFLERLREIKGSASVPVVILSARSQASEVLSGLTVNGVVDYITKPFTKDELKKRLRRALGNG